VNRWCEVSTLDDLWEGEMLAVTVDGVDLLLCGVEGQVVAFEDLCPHQAHPLSKGNLDGSILTCAAHEWSFDAGTGHGINPATACLRSYPVRLDGATILVDLERPDR
jgi:toluene monooxygenase system ferredoxin subunit